MFVPPKEDVGSIPENSYYFCNSAVTAHFGFNSYALMTIFI